MGSEMKVLVIGVAGGTGSGKTTVAKKIAAAFQRHEVVLFDQDSYYNDLSHLPLSERRKINYDHPDAFDTDLLEQHLALLRAGHSVDKPVYSYALHCRTRKTARISPAPIVLLEGILVLEEKRLRELMDIKIFVDTEDDIRLIRRLRRDIHERGRNIESVLSQYENTVRPMHLSFILPSKRHADIVIPRGGENDVAIKVVISTIRERLRSLAHENEKQSS